MPTPRALLRTFLVNRFSTSGALERLVQDNFDQLTADINWQASLVEQAESIVGLLSDKGLLTVLWPILMREREAYVDEIRGMQTAWTAGSAGVVAPSLSASNLAFLDRESLVGVYRAARAAHLDDMRPALLAGLPDDLVATLPLVPNPSAQLLSDLDRLNRLPGDPPPLRIWLENSRLLLDGDVIGQAFERVLVELAKVATSASSGQTAPAPDTEQSEAAVTYALEAAVLSVARPALRVSGVGFDPSRSEIWHELLDRHRATMTAAVAATGRLDSPGHPEVPWVGTGAVVGEDLICTARHLVDSFWPPNAARAEWTLVFDPWRDVSPRAGFNALPVTEVVLRHPVLDVAFLRVPGLYAAGVRPLIVAARAPHLGRDVARVTFVGADGRVDQELQAKVFAGMLEGGKWILPGKVTRVPTADRGKSAGTDDLLEYDTNTFGGTGGPVVDVVTGLIVAFATQRLYLLGNRGVPAWYLLRDSRVRALGIALPPGAPAPDDPWAKAWEPEASHASDKRVE